MFQQYFIHYFTSLYPDAVKALIDHFKLSAQHFEKMFNKPTDISPDVPPLKSLEESTLFQRRIHTSENFVEIRDSNGSSTTADYDFVSESESTLVTPRVQVNPLFDRPDSVQSQKFAHSHTVQSHIQNINNLTTGLSMDHMICTRCNEGFDPNEKIVNTTGQLWHQQCFVCAQCFQQFENGVFYEYDDRKYCERDFQVLFAPCCGRCGNFIIGRVIKAMNASWHPECFRCEMCTLELADTGFIKNAGQALCHECNAKVKARGLGKYVCHKCHAIIDDQPLKFRGEVYHPYHFNCTGCGVELDSNAREVRSRPGLAVNDTNELYCLRCHDKMGIPICGACRRPIEERVVTALGKHWHVEHFVCAKCEKPFFGHRHYEKKGLAYCETHYHQLFGNLCHVCNQVIAGDVFTALNKAWCVHHFACSVCDQKMNQKTKFYECDLKPVCKKCYEKFPAELRRRLKRQHEASPKKLLPS